MHRSERPTPDQQPLPEQAAREPDAASPQPAVQEVLALQRTAGNAAVARLVHGRGGGVLARLRPAATHHTFAELDAMTLTDFEAFAQSQADWATEPGRDAATPAMADAEKDKLRALLEFAREAEGGKQPILAGCGGMTVHNLLATTLDDAARNDLRRYGRAVAKATVTVQLNPTTDVARARQYGQALAKLEVTPGPGVSHTIFKQTEGADQLGELIDKGYVDDFIRYCTTCSPLLEADNGAELASYLALRKEGADPVTYHGIIKEVRNYHRFEKALLDALVGNLLYLLKNKPLFLVLHSSFDHNGAFHRDPNLTAIFTDTRHLALMVEGKASLAEMSAELHPIATTWGQGDRIQQVMIAGHGNSQIIQLAGTLDTASLDAGGTNEAAEQDDALRSDTGHTAATDAFMAELLRNMASDPSARVVLNGCLTASNSVNAPLSPDPAIAAGQVQGAIAAQPSLATYLGQAAAAAGNPAQVRGANASFGQVGLEDAAGNLDIVPSAAAPDPLLTAAKVDYIRGGNEPQGCLRAVLEVWADDRIHGTRGALDAVHTRLGTADSTAWDQRIIRTMYGIVEANPDNAELIRQLGNCAGDVSELKFERSCNVAALGSVPDAQMDTIFTGLTTADWWTSIPRLPLVVNQAWMRHTPAKKADFMTALGGPTFTCRTAQRFVDFAALGPHLGALLPVGHAPAASRAETILALLGVETDEAAPEHHSKQFLVAAWGAGPSFPAALGVEGLLDSLSTAADVERSIGVRAPLGGGGGGGGAAGPVLNVDLDRDGINDFHIEPMTRSGAVTASKLNVRARPSMAGHIVEVIDQGVEVDAIGRSGQWYAIEHNDRTAFVFESWIKLDAQL